MRILRKAVLMAATVTAVVGLGVGTALADPPSGTVPRTTDIVGAGSDTIQALFDQFSPDYNAQTPAPTSKLYSFDAVNPTTGLPGDTISTKNDTNCSTSRPNGSGGGLTALEAGDKTADGNFCIDFARSSRGPQTTDPAGLAFVAFARDAVTWSATSGGNAPATLTQAQLKGIYQCTDTTWNQVGGSSTATIVPVLPQASSGTRQFFLQAIGVTTPGTCVQSTTDIEENEGTNAVFSGTNAPNVVFPYSVAVNLAQTEHGHNSTVNNPGNLTLREVAGVLPTTGTSPNITINTAFPSAFLRLVYDVVRTASTTDHIPAYLDGIFGSKGWICTNATAKSDIASYGFLSLGAACGAVQLTPIG